MAGAEGHRRGKPLEMLQLIAITHVLNVISTCSATVESHGQAFIQTDKQLRYTGDSSIDRMPLHSFPGSEIPDISISEQNIQSSPIKFEPPMLDFLEQPVGMPHLQQVTVINADTQNSLHLVSISGSTTHFHCSFFQDKMVSPGGNTSFDVVFLAREVGNVENTLYIHTSQGSHKYQVFGVGIANPYRIRPFLGAKVPLNSSFSPLIHMHNPHGSTLQVVEMYSSGGDLHLELPTGEKEASKKLWEILPYETKPVMRASFVGRKENNHTAFIRIKTSRESEKEILILPVEVEVTSSPGIFSPLELLDFGILRTLDDPKVLRLNLLNSGPKPVHISSISVSPPNDAISIEFRPMKLHPDLLQPTNVAMISFTASKAVHRNQWAGRIIVKSKGSQHRISIPYHANVLHGSLIYNRNKTLFHNYYKAKSAENVTRDFPLTNTFNFTLVIYNISLPPEMAPYFSVEKFTGPVKLPPQKSLPLFKLTHHPPEVGLQLNTQLHVFTNASVFNIPLIVYNGKLKVVHHRPEIFKGQLDFGTLGILEKRSMTFTIRNENPVDMVIRDFKANMENSVLELLGVEKGNGTMLQKKHNVSQADINPLILKPNHYAVFNCNLVAPNYEGSFAAEVIISTQFEYLYIPITLRTAKGSVTSKPEKQVFDKCFPGKVPYTELKLHSTFESYMEVRQVRFQPNDTRFYFKPKDKPNLLYPHQDITVGRLYFDARKTCQEDCYVGLPTYVPAGHQWLLGATLDKEVADTDQYLYTRLQQKWDLLGMQQTSIINVTIQLDTDHVRGFLFPAQAHLHWPLISTKQKIIFPLTQIGNLSISDFKIENPADVPVLVQILPLASYPNPQTILDMVSSKLSADLSEYIELDDPSVFTLQDLELYNPSPRNPVPDWRKSIENSLGVRPHNESIGIMLQGGGGVRLRVGFQPRDDTPKMSLIILRNNLTIIDTVIVQGRGGNGEMKFGNKKSGSTTPFTLEMLEKHLKGCDKKKQSKITPPNFSVRKTFTAKNTGELPFYIHGYSINDAECEGYGFKVLDCRGFELLPNTSKKLDIAFTPDFTMSRVRRTLSIHTSLGAPLNFTFQATVPAHMLTKCAAALPRPSWEPILYYSAICIMGFLLFCAMIASYFEADRIFMDDILKRKSKQLNTTVFDLKAIAKSATSSQHSDNKQPALIRNGTPSASVNGHVPLQRKTSRESAITPSRASPAPQTPSFWSNISIRPIIHRMFSWLKFHRVPKKSHSSSPPHRSPQDTEANDTKDSSNHIKANRVMETTTLVRDSSSFSGDKPPNNSSTTNSNGKLNKKSSKAARRQNSDLYQDNCVPTVDKAQNSPLDYTPAITTSSIAINARDERKTKPKKLEKNNHLPIDSLEPIEVYDLDLDMKKDDKRKKNNNKEKRMKERRPDLLPDNDKDDSSSTTTESSSLEADEKTSSARESTPEPQAPKSKKLKVKSKGNKGKKNDEDNEINDDDFVITSKSKAHKRVKVDSKNYGGNIHDANTLELPYTTKLEAASRNKDVLEEPTSPHAIAACVTDKVYNRRNKTKTKGTKQGDRHKATLSLDTDSTCSSDLGKESPPIWDMPKLNPASRHGDLSEISEQTEQFARKNGPAPDLVPTSRTNNTYSSIVSNEPSKIGQFAIDTFDISTLPTFPVKNDYKNNIGTIGNTRTTDGVTNRRAWQNPSSTATTTGSSSLLSNFFPESLNAQAGPETNGYQHAFASKPITTNSSDGMSMMQRLQQERHKRRYEYQQKLLGENPPPREAEWPGFDMRPTGLLWDNQEGNSLLYPTLNDSPPTVNSIWNNEPSIWSPMSGSNSPTTTMLNAPFRSTNSPIQAPMTSQATDTSPTTDSGPLGSFDPFRTLGNIWQTSRGDSQGGYSWSVPRPDEDQN